MAWSNSVLHIPLQERVTSFIKHHGGECYDTTIHKTHPELSQKIKNHTFPSSKALSARADLFVLPREGKKETFFLDIKTSFKYKLGTNENTKAMVFEALQVALHKAEYMAAGVKCMYIAQDKDKVERAFWIHEIPEIWELLRPSDTKYSYTLQTKIVGFLLHDDSQKFRNTGPIHRIDEYGEKASGDMMVTLPPPSLTESSPNWMHNWEELLIDAL